MKAQYLSRSALAFFFTFLLNPVLSADCNQQAISGDPQPQDIATFLTNALNGGAICAGGFPPNNPLTNVFNANLMDFNVTRSTPDGAVDLCMGAFQDIISQCVQTENKWGGQWQLNGQFYSISNQAFPANGIAGPRSSQPSPSAPPGPAGGAPAGPFTIDGGNGQPITIPPQTATQSGTFSTAFVSGVTANTATTTSLSGQSGPTILPIWFCSKCIAAAAGILVIPALAPAAGGLIPPPPGFPALAIGPNGLPTPTGSPASGAQPSGDPRSSPTSPGDPAQSPVDPPDVQGPCQYWSVGGSKREVAEVIQRRETIVSHRPLTKRAEAEISVPRPLISALKALGSADVVKSANELTLVTTKFPKPEMENRFVTGLQGKVTSKVNVAYMGQTINMNPGDLFRIRWDYDPSKGVHVNAEFFGSAGTTKIAFTPSSRPIVDPPDNRNPLLYQQVIMDQSRSLDYQIKPNEPGTVFTPQQRTGENSPAAQEAALKAMAQKLAQKWEAVTC
ncbi:hypothetical protein FGG08_003118 [Glutinoglossum americanum]|uniref:Uncharacterized protein n=1 Tax=Glutinoglossum americanum TaxID=1670608 RepID=A0A9P8L522_9PEZI|nr:hypothetical protein FGG08_003118 [Glutinoglossum americanum]